MAVATSKCTATIKSKAVPNHTHTCTGKHSEDNDHYCGVCKRFWWTK